MLSFGRNEIGQRWSGHVMLKSAGLRVETADCVEPLAVSEFRFGHRRFQHRDRPVIDQGGHRIRLPVLAPVSEREPGRIGETARSAVYNLGDHSERAHGSRADARHKQQRRKLGRFAIGRRSQSAVQSPHHHVFRADVVMGRHNEVREKRLALRCR